MGILDTLNGINVTLPVLGTVGGVGIAAGLIMIFLLRRKKTISFKV